MQTAAISCGHKGIHWYDDIGHSNASSLKTAERKRQYRTGLICVDEMTSELWVLTIIPSGVITPIYCPSESLETYRISVLVTSQSQWCSGLQSESLLTHLKHFKELNRLELIRNGLFPPCAVLSAP